MKDFKNIYLEELLKHEGGWSNHPKDPGRMTKWGVTKKVWDKWTGRKSTEAEMRNLKISDVTPLYKKWYWDVVKAEELPLGLDLCVFDFSVNAGPIRAIKYLQKLVGVKDDGIFGNMTRNAIDIYIHTIGSECAVRQYQLSRGKYYMSLKNFKTFGRGWTKRVKEITKKALEILNN